LSARTGGSDRWHCRKKPLLDTVARLKELGIEDQLQLARLMFLVFAPLILQELVVGDGSRLARF
jgi:hypothetical protein